MPALCTAGLPTPCSDSTGSRLRANASLVALRRLRLRGRARCGAIVNVLERSMRWILRLYAGSTAAKGRGPGPDTHSGRTVPMPSHARWTRALAICALIWSPVAGPSATSLGAQQGPAQPLGSSSGPERVDRLRREATFDSVWNRVYHTHYDPGFAGVDWSAVRLELRPRALEASSGAELRSVLTEMLDRLGQSHFTIIPGASATVFERPGGGSPGGEGDPGIDTRWIGGSLLVTMVRDGSPAEQAGILQGWAVEGVDGVSIAALAAEIQEAAPSGSEERDLATWLPAAVRRRLLGVEGTSVRLALRDHGDELQPVSVVRAAPPGSRIEFGNLPPVRVEAEHRIEELAGGLQVGVIRMTAWFPAVVPAIAQAVDQMRDADAIIFDLRGNPGGVGALVMGIGGHFVNEAVSLGTMQTRDATLRFVVNPQRVAPDGRRVDPYDGPLLILVDALTASTSEIFAGGLQALGRATIVGETTAGQALPALVVALPNGDRFMHAIADFTGPDGSRLEGTGVRPDVSVALDRGALIRDADPALEEAFRWISTVGVLRE